MPCSLSLSLARTRAAPVVAGLRQILCGAAACLELKATARVLRAEERLSVAFLSDTLPAEWMHARALEALPVVVGGSAVSPASFSGCRPVSLNPACRGGWVG